MRLVLASHNRGKVTELARILGELAPGIEVLGLSDVVSYPEPAETEATFEGNALLKARACVEATGFPSLADDSGLEVDALNGDPGVRSARWAGEKASDQANVAKLLAQLSALPNAARTARFVCAAALVSPDGSEVVCHGELTGSIIDTPRGSNGFGYDPVFVPDSYDQTTAELSPAEKDAISHRGAALREIAPLIVELAESAGVT